MVAVSSKKSPCRKPLRPRGRPIVPDEELQNCRVMVKFTQSDHDEMREAAFEEHLSMSAFLRRIIAEGMRNRKKNKPR